MMGWLAAAGALLALVASGGDHAPAQIEDRAEIIKLVLAQYDDESGASDDSLKHLTCVSRVIPAEVDDAGSETGAAAQVEPQMLAASQKIVDLSSLENGLPGYVPRGCDSLLKLSRFEIAGDEAAISVDWICGGMCGAGERLLLGRRKDGWTITMRQQVWIS